MPNNNFTNLDQFKNTVINRLKAMRVKAVSELMATFYDTAMTECPVEDGHSHEAMLTTMQEVGGELSGGTFNNVARKHMSKRSRSVVAAQASTGMIGEAGDDYVVMIQIRLPFMRKLERGLLIRVGDISGNRGPKVNPVLRPPGKGELYGPRASKGTFGGLRPSGRSKLSPSEAAKIRKGVGLLVWEENGVIKRDIVRRPRAAGFWRKAISAVRRRARQLKLKSR